MFNGTSEQAGMGAGNREIAHMTEGKQKMFQACGI